MFDKQCDKCGRKAVIQYNMRFLCAEHAFAETKDKVRPR